MPNRLTNSQHARQPLRLLTPGVVEGNIEMAPNALRDIPVGFTVADGENAGGVHDGGLSLNFCPVPLKTKPACRRRRAGGLVGYIIQPSKSLA
jgi:hypothetical protein